MKEKSKLMAFLRSKIMLLLIVSLVILVLLPLAVTNSLFVYILTNIFIFAIFAASWNFLANSGQGSLGHALFLGIGGFSSAIIGGRISAFLAGALGITQMTFGVASVMIQVVVLLLGGLISAGIGLLIGLACVRLKAWYLAMVTFGFSVIASTLSSQFDSVTNGINGFAPVILVPSGFPFYILVISFFFTSIISMYLVMKSRIGLAFRAIHGNEAEAKMIGVNTAKYKLIAFVISTFFAGLAGGLYAYFLQFIQNEIFSPANSFLPLMMSVIGGLGTIAGPIIGAVFLVSVQQVLALPNVVESLNGTLGSVFPNVSNVGPPLSMLLIGVILLVIVIFAPKGLVSVFRKIYVYFVTDDSKKEVKKSNEGK